jgi:hypothetical protein
MYNLNEIETIWYQFKTIWWILSDNHANNNLCTWQNAFSRHRMDSFLWFKRMELMEVKSLIWAIFWSESHEHRWAKTIEEGGPLLSMSSIKLGLLNENDELNKVELF